MSHIISYGERLKNFSWHAAEQELEYSEGDILNIGWYCSDRNCKKGMGDKPALIWEGAHTEEKRFTFNEIRLASNTIGHHLRNLGIGQEDRVSLFMDRIPELYMSFLGILKIGAIAQPLFSAFGDESLYLRLNNARTRAIITQSRYVGKIRRILAKMPFLEHIIIVDHHENKPLEKRESCFFLKTAKVVEELEIFPAKAETPSLLHYTSGTTGSPKGVMHVHYSLIAQYLTARWVLDLREKDIFWCTADPGWVTGTSYGIIGPWSQGITQCVLDRGFSAQTWYEFIEKNRVTVWYSAPTAIRSLMKAGNQVVKQFDLSSLRHLASVGEPLNREAVIWSEKVYGRKFHDTYWQTETGAIMIANFPGLKIKPGSMGKPFPGINAAVLDEKNLEPLKKPNRPGVLAFKAGWPSMMRAYWNSEETYKNKFVRGWYLSGDRVTIDADGYFWFISRDDDIINTGGHLVSPFEIESVLLEHEAVAESAVVAKPDKMKMEVVKAFITLNPGHAPGEDLELNIMNFIRKKLSSIAMPQEVEFMEKLPKTRSGKIMRRMLRAKEWGEETGDTSTLDE